MVDICNPPLMWIDGRCYRVNSNDECVVTSGYTGEDQYNVYEEDVVTEEIQETFNHQIEEVGGNRFKVSLPVASAFFSLIIGKGGQTRNRLESDTKTKIVVPRQGQEGDIVVSGSDRRGVMAAANRIDAMVASARIRQPFTHFLSIPVNSHHIQEAFNQFKKEVLECCQSVRGIEDTIFQTESLLHLTVGTMALLDQRERDLARDILLDCKEHVILPLLGSETLSFEVEGLEYMNDDPAEVDVLYVKIKDETGILQQIADMIVDKFVSSGLMKKEYDRVKLHLTVMNTLFRKEQGDIGEKQNKNTKVRESFDCRPILEGWNEIHFGTVQLEEIHLSQRRAGRRTAEGYYLPSAIVTINSCG